MTTELHWPHVAGFTGAPHARLDIGSDAPFVLEGDRAWLVRSGPVDVFAVRMQSGRMVGARTHLFRAETGQTLFGLGDVTAAERVLLAVGTSGSIVEVAEQETLRALMRTADSAAIVAMLDGWVEMLCAAIARGTVPKRCDELEVGRELRMERTGAARPRRGVAWIRHVEGHSLLLGKDELVVNGKGFTPISHRAWLHVTEDARVTLQETADVGDPIALWDGLARLHDLVLRNSAIAAERAARDERVRMQRKAAANRGAMLRACASLAGTMDGGAPAGGRVARELRMRTDGGNEAERLGDALFAACRLVGEALAVVVKSPAKTEGAATPRDPLDAIARASRLRTRTVALRDAWWTQESGPLLGYLTADRRPVALIPGRRGYVLHDPLGRRQEPLTAELAVELEPFAFTFYRPFPDAALTLTDVIKLGFLGCKRDLVMVVLMGSIAALLGLVPSIATGMLFNTVIPGAQRSQLLQMTIVLVVCAFSTSMFNITRSIALLRVEGRMATTIQSAVWDRLLGLPMPFFRPYAAGDLAVRAMGIDAMRQVISGSTVTAILGGLFSLFNFGLMFWYSPAMAWRASLLIALALGITMLGSYLQLKHQRGVYNLQAKTSGLVLQLLTGVAKLRVAGAEAPAFAMWTRRFSEQRQLSFRARRIANWVSAFNAGFPLLAYIVIFWFALPLLGPDGGVRTGDFLAFLSAYGTSQGALLATCLALLSTLSTVPMYEQSKPILMTPPEVDVGKSDPGQLSGDIEIQHAMFRYSAGGPLVLRDLTLQIKPGEFVAFVGPSGSGKSTILRLLLGFEALESGSIYFDGQELGNLDIRSVRQQIGVVLQSGRLMSGDIYTNIVGSAPLTMDDAWEAARMAGFAEDVQGMPMGMHTVISEGGGTLSGGQRQRLMISRAIVQRPRILLFDEATSALDNRTQAIVSASLERLQATRIVVAHRLSTIVNADRIFVIDRGKITECGSYAELMARDGLFAELARRQLT